MNISPIFISIMKHRKINFHDFGGMKYWAIEAVELTSDSATVLWPQRWQVMRMRGRPAGVSVLAGVARVVEAAEFSVVCLIVDALGVNGALKDAPSEGGAA